jgi:hypothetical protein
MELKNDKAKAQETILVLVGAFIIFDWTTHKKIFLLLALVLIVIASVSDSLTNLISRGWLKLAELMGAIMSKVMLTVIYFIVLLPVALMYRLTGKDPLQFKKKQDTYYFSRNHLYNKKDIENIW